MNRIVHLGLGNFHRAHQAWYTANAGDWKITGIVMSNAALKTQLAQHNNEYVLGTWDVHGLSTQRIDVYDDVLLASEQASAVIDKIADVETHIVTITITEKGYYFRPGTNALDLSNCSIKNDLHSDTPKTAIGLLAAGLIRRCSTASTPLTVISCDNLANNGHKLRQIIVDYVREIHPDALAWISDNVSFPNCMVDRITPRLNDATVAEINSLQGTSGLSTVGTEAFSEWIIEDVFASPRPDWNKAGAIYVDNVESFEQRKLRLLNAAHSYLAYAGLLAGHEFVHQAIADPVLKSKVNALWDEAASTVSQPAAQSLHDYRAALLDRFAVPHMRHRLDQIAMDGSLKLRERLVPIIKERTMAAQHSPASTDAIAVWARFVKVQIDAQKVLHDANSEQLSKLVNDSPSNAEQRLVAFIADDIATR